MATEEEKFLVSTLQSSQQKFKYFIIGLDLACIGYILKYTESIKIMSPDLYVLLFSLFFLFFSIYNAIKSIGYYHLYIMGNIQILSEKDQPLINQIVDDSFKERINGANTIKEYMKNVTESENDKMGKLFNSTINFLYIGIIFFIVWRILNLLEVKLW